MKKDYYSIFKNMDINEVGLTIHTFSIAGKYGMVKKEHEKDYLELLEIAINATIDKKYTREQAKKIVADTFELVFNEDSMPFVFLATQGILMGSLSDRTLFYDLIKEYYKEC